MIRKYAGMSSEVCGWWYVYFMLECAYSDDLDAETKTKILHTDISFLTS